jgi:hypothetical protein
MAYDSDRRVTVVYGGSLGNDDTLEWNGAAWRQRMIFGPGGVQFPAMAYDAARRAIVLVGSNSWQNPGRTWELACLVITANPQPRLLCPGQTAEFGVEARQTGPFSYRWQIAGEDSTSDWMDLTNGDRPGVGTVAGAQSPSLTIGEVVISPAMLEGLSIRCIVSNACGSTTSKPASLSICVADFNCSGGSPDDADVDAFFTAWNSGETSADVNGSGGAPDDADVDEFFTRWNAGC